MDTDRFDALTLAVSTVLSRRILAGVLGLGALALPGAIDAKKKKHKKVKRNDFGCVNVGDFCTNSGQCCSGKCKGKKGKRKCRAHDVSTCQGQDGCVDPLVVCTSTTGNVGACVVTTGNAAYCEADSDCFDCTTDADCVPFCGAGAACIVCAPCAERGLQTACAGLSSCNIPT